MSKLTLKEKQLINEHVTKETERCLDIIELAFAKAFSVEDLYKTIVEDIVENHPYIKFNLELRKRIPQW